MICRCKLAVIGGVVMWFEKDGRCVLGLHWLQSPLDIIWPCLQSGD
jgi:hypothetical protein